MLSKTTYTCEICGFFSENRQEVEACEAQGLNTAYKKGDKVILLAGPDVTGRHWPEREGTIVDVFVDRRTHNFRNYNVEFGGYYAIAMFVENAHLRPCPNPTTTAA